MAGSDRPSTPPLARMPSRPLEALRSHGAGLRCRLHRVLDRLTGHPKASPNQQNSVNDLKFIEYLQELGISETEIALANRERQSSMTELPIVLWSYGLIDLEKLGKIFDWLEKAA